MKSKFRTAFGLTGLLALASAPAFAGLPMPPMPPLPRLEIRIGTTAPPPVRREVRPVRPDSDHVWVGGSWDWRGDQWAWVDGRWDRPERRDVRWVKARYVRVRGGWRYEPAHWSNQQFVEGDDYRSWKERNKKQKHRGRQKDRGRSEGRRQDGR